MKTRYWILIEVIMFIIMTVLVLKYGMIKTAIVYLLLCESISSINRIMERYLKKLKEDNDRIEKIISDLNKKCEKRVDSFLVVE